MDFWADPGQLDEDELHEVCFLKSIQHLNFLDSASSIYEFWFMLSLTFHAPCISESCTTIKIDSNFYFHTSLWSLKSFYESLHKAFGGTTKKCENKNLS